MKYLLANFKQNFDTATFSHWLTFFSQHLQPSPDTQIILSPSYPFLNLSPLQNLRPQIQVAAQNISRYPAGPHTGQVGLTQIQPLIDACLVGHSESRRELHETDHDVAAKVKLLLGTKTTPVICVDTPYLESQITLLKHDLTDFTEVIFAFEPLSAIGTGKPDSPKIANQIAFKIKSLTSRSTPVLYGGSVDPENIHDFLSQDYLDGALIGTSSLDPSVFIQLLNHV